MRHQPKELRKVKRGMLMMIKSYEELLNQLDLTITCSRVGKMNVAKELKMPYKTFYRKLKNKTFTQKEVLAISRFVNKHEKK